MAARRRGRPRHAGARAAGQPGRAVGDDARRDEARRDPDPGHHAAGAGGPARPHRPRPRRRRDRPVRARAALRGRPRLLPAHRGRRPGRRAGCATPTPRPACSTSAPTQPTRADDPLLLYFTSGTTALPKLVEHTHVSYPIGHLSTMYWIGLQPGDVHLNVSSPGWAKHAWSCVFAPWIAGATICLFNYERFDASGDARRAARCEGHDVLRTADGVAHARPAGPRGVEGRPVAARGGRRGRAAQPRGDRRRPARLGADDPRRVRADRDLAADRQLAGAGAQARVDGQTDAGLLDHPRRSAHRRAGERRQPGGRDLRRPRRPSGRSG